jgi:hypothetical protein
MVEVDTNCFHCPDSDWLYDKSMNATSYVSGKDFNELLWGDTIQYFEETLPFILAISVGYVYSVLKHNAMVDRDERQGIEREPVSRGWIIAGRYWNLSMCVFSTVGSYYTVNLLFSLPTSGNISDTDLKNLKCLLWIFLYLVSKPFELIDTVILMGKSIKVITLHWSHHVITLLYCWYSALTTSIIGMYFGIINYMAHSIMYGYYFCVSFKLLKPIFKKVSKVITIVQITQFASVLAGLGIFYKSLSFKMLVITVLMYLYYFIIFIVFYINTYSKKKCHDCGKKAKVKKCERCKQNCCKDCMENNKCIMCNI